MPELVHDWRFVLEKRTSSGFSNIEWNSYMRYDINQWVREWVSKHAQRAHRQAHMCSAWYSYLLMEKRLIVLFGAAVIS